MEIPILILYFANKKPPQNKIKHGRHQEDIIRNSKHEINLESYIKTENISVFLLIFNKLDKIIKYK